MSSSASLAPEAPKHGELFPKTSSASSRLALYALGAITFIGGFLRFYQINRNGFWLDEAFSVWMAEHPLSTLFHWLTLIDQHPPLYYTLLHFWLLPGNDAAYVRALSACFSTLTIPIMFFIAARISGLRAGIIAAIILALSPFQVRFAQEARMYALLMLNVSLATLALTYLLTEPRSVTRPLGWQLRSFVRTCRRPAQPRRVLLAESTNDIAWFAYMLFTAASVLTHNTALFYPIATNLFVIGFILYRRKRAAAASYDGVVRSFSPPSLRNWLWAQVGMLLLWSVWSVAFVIQSVGVFNEFWIPAPTAVTVVAALQALLNDSLPQYVTQAGMVWFGCAMLLVLGAFYLRKRPPVLVFLLVLLLTPLVGELLVSLRRPIFYDRTLIWATIPLYLLLTFGILQLRFKVLISVALVLLCTLNLISLRNYYENFKKEQWREAATYMARNVDEDDLILFNATWVQIPFDYYFKRFDRPVTQHGVPVDMFDRGVLEPKMTESDLPRLRSLLNDRDRVWLVYSHDWYTDPQGIIPAALEKELHHVGTQHYTGLQILSYERR